MKKIILFKSKSEKYEKLFSESNYVVSFIEPLQFVFVNKAILADMLLEPNYDGLILTSPRAILAVAACWDSARRSLWAGKKIYVVGDTSGNLVQEHMQVEVRGSDSGDAINLARVISEENSDGRFLFPGGNLRSEKLISKLSEKGLCVDSVCVYNTLKSDSLRERVCSESDVSGVVYFSGSGCKYVLEERQWECAQFAVGESTASAMRAVGVEPSGVASKPTAEALVHTLNLHFLRDES